MPDADELREIDEALRHHRASLTHFTQQGDERFAAIARQKIDDLLERRYALHGLDGELDILLTQESA